MAGGEAGELELGRGEVRGARAKPAGRSGELAKVRLGFGELHLHAYPRGSLSQSTARLKDVFVMLTIARAVYKVK